MVNNAWSSIEGVPYCFFKGHQSNCKVTRLKKIVNFDPNYAFPDCNSSLNSPMATKWCKKLKVAYKRCPIVFRGHPSDFKVTRAENRRSESNLSKITRPVAAIKSLRFALFILRRAQLVNITRGPMSRERRQTYTNQFDVIKSQGILTGIWCHVWAVLYTRIMSFHSPFKKKPCKYRSQG